MKRIYEEAKTADGVRILIDRLWPRGVSKEAAKLHYWLKDLAPSEEPRKWFDHDEDKFLTFEKKYRKELESGDQKEAFEALQQIVNRTKNRVTLVYAAKDEKNNNAQVIKKMIQ